LVPSLLFNTPDSLVRLQELSSGRM
jgi:hypothetical protein